ncbi:hypothetical protein PALB_19140 [Pseudoalteromonas luteoviolacea B = ATCC 29581]|nr:hypothetical protein PALB_19140 [Pseudoalteromonas luteoviolacea B = ATCC 29581]
MRYHNEIRDKLLVNLVYVANKPPKNKKNYTDCKKHVI